MIGLPELLSSVLGGGVTGLAGVVVQRIAEHKAKKLDIEANREKYAHEVAMRKADAEIMAQEWAARVKVAETEQAGKEAAADAEAFNAALTAEPQRFSDAGKMTTAQNWLMVLLDLFRGAIRPVLTVYLCAITTVVYLESRALMVMAPVDPSRAAAQVELIINTVLYLTTTCVLFWFGTRNKQKAPKIG